ncbi:F-box only protein 36-like [Glandiceps talaboti]
MASLLKGGVILDLTGQAPSPLKDFHQLQITQQEVIWRWWKISLRNDKKVAPGEVRESHDDFLYDDRTQSEVRRVFGERVLDYCKNICDGNIDYIVRLPKPLLFLLASYLEIEDVLSLAQTCKVFRDICSSDTLWEQIYTDHTDTVTDEVRSLARDDGGWKQLFFTDKLRLQVKLRRKRSAEAKSSGQQAFLTDKS